MQSQGVSQQDLINQWNNLRQYDIASGVLEDIQVHINKFERIFININPKTSGITDRRKSEQLIKSIYFTRYQSIIGRWILMIEMPEDDKNPFPTYNTVKDHIMKYDQIVSKHENESGDIITSGNGFMAASPSTYKTSSNVLSSTITCLSCGKRGHIRKDCYNEPVKCTVPGCRQWHPTQFHDKFTSGKVSGDRLNIGRGMSSGRSVFRGRETSLGSINSGRGSMVSQQSMTSLSTSSKSDNYAAKKPTNIKSKFLSKSAKKVYFTYTDEFGNNLNDQVYQENNEMDQDNQDSFDKNDEDEMEDDEEIM
jgi:hypothetical protein